MRQDFPEIVDPVGLAGRHDAVVDGPHLARCLVFDRLPLSTHEAASLGS